MKIKINNVQEPDYSEQRIKELRARDSLDEYEKSSLAFELEINKRAKEMLKMDRDRFKYVTNLSGGSTVVDKLVTDEDKTYLDGEEVLMTEIELTCIYKNVFGCSHPKHSEIKYGLGRGYSVVREFGVCKKDLCPIEEGFELGINEKIAKLESDIEDLKKQRDEQVFKLKDREGFTEREKIDIYDKVYTEVAEYVDYVNSDKYHTDNDYVHFLYESVVTAVAGDEFWEYINNKE